jgi:hypothetical protein
MKSTTFFTDDQGRLEAVKRVKSSIPVAELGAVARAPPARGPSWFSDGRYDRPTKEMVERHRSALSGGLDTLQLRILCNGDCFCAVQRGPVGTIAPGKSRFVPCARRELKKKQPWTVHDIVHVRKLEIHVKYTWYAFGFGKPKN